MRNLILCIVFTFSGSLSLFAQDSADKQERVYSSADDLRFKNFAHELDSLRKTKHIPGLSAVILKDQETIWSSGFGSSHFDTGDGAHFKKVTPDTPFWIASVTKPFVGLLFLKLNERGVIDLNDPINNMPGWENFCTWLADSPIVFGQNLQCGSTITLRNVLNHTVNDEPGTSFLYNPLMYSRLSRYLEYVHGNPISAAEGRHNTLAQLMEEHVLGPAEMSRTMAGLWQREKPLVYFDMAQGFEFKNGEYVRKPHIERHFAGGAGIVSTAHDLALFDIGLDTKTIASDTVLNELFTPAVAPDGTTLPYAFGWYVQQYRGEKLIWHAGWDEKAGFSALYLKVPDQKMTLIVLANSEGMWWGNPLDKAEVEGSPFAQLFFKHFIFKDRQ